MVNLGDTELSWGVSPNSLAGCSACGASLKKGQVRLKKVTSDFGGRAQYVCRSCAHRSLVSLEKQYQSLKK